MVRAFNEEEVQTLKQSLIGRALLPPEPGKDKLTKVYIVKSLLEGFEAKYNEDITLSTWPWGLSLPLVAGSPLTPAVRIGPSR